MQITLELPDDLVNQISALHDQVPQILALGLHELNAELQVGFSGAAEVLEFLASLPSPEQMSALRPSEGLQTQISVWLEKNRTQGLTPAEEQAWQQYQYLENSVRLAKAQALLKLKQQNDK